MAELLEEDVWWCVAGLSDKVSDVLHDKNRPCFLAGGYIRSRVAGEPVNDIDLFVSNNAHACEIAGNLTASGGETYRSGNAITVRVDGQCIQMIHRWTFSTPQECVQSFDFTIARAAIWWDLDKLEWKSTCDDRFYADLAAKRLTYCCPSRNEDAGGSILRALKFTGRGYRIPQKDLGKVIARLMSAVEIPKVSNGNLASDVTLNEDQLGHVLAGLLYEVDPNVADRVARREKRR